MKAARLAELLLQTPNAEVFAYDADVSRLMPVTGIVGDTVRQELCTDDPEAGEEKEGMRPWTGTHTEAYVKRMREVFAARKPRP